MAALLINLFITSLYCLSLTADGRFLPSRMDDEDFQPVCSRKCDPSPGDSSRDGTLPLYQCSCSKSCAVYGDCCYNSSFRSTGQSPEYDFVCLSVVARGKYRAVSSCTPDQRSDTCRNALGHLPPVTSRVTNITYGNVFCAMCNGDGENLITWNVHLRCYSEDDDDSVSEATTIVYESGAFWKLDEWDRTRTSCEYYEDDDESSVLDGLELRPCTNQRLISRCSPSWTDLSVREKCRSYEDPVFFHDTAYRNLHCAECNYMNAAYADCFPFYVKHALEMELYDPRLFEFCEKRGCVRSMPDRGPGHTFGQMFDIHSCIRPEGELCCPNERYHFKTRKCRRFRTG